MLVSVVMTARNTAPYVSAAISSVLASSHRDLELVFVDDGSTDQTAEIAAGWGSADSRVRVIGLNHVGRLEALRIAHEQANGEVHCWVDSDDLVDPDGIDLCLGALDDEHGIAYSHRWLIDQRGRRRGSHQKNHVPYSATRLLVSNMVFHLRLFRRDVFNAAGGVGDLSSAIDWDLNLRMTEHTGVRCVPIELYSYRVRPGRMSGTPHQARNGEVAVRRALERRELDLELAVEERRWTLQQPSTHAGPMSPPTMSSLRGPVDQLMSGASS
jgi:glycosyltransferase involved in cell wall biosynthesis